MCPVEFPLKCHRFKIRPHNLLVDHWPVWSVFNLLLSVRYFRLCVLHDSQKILSTSVYWMQINTSTNLSMKLYIYSLVLLSTVAHQSHLIQHPKNFLPLHDVHGDELLGNNKKYTAETEINLRRVIGAFICLCPKAVTGTVQLQDER